MLVDQNGDLTPGKGESITPEIDPATAEVDIEVTQSRVLVYPLPVVVPESRIYLDDKTRAEIEYEQMRKELGLMKCLVKEVGPGTYTEKGALIPMSIAVGQMVYVFPNNFEADLNVNGVRHLIYHERNIIAKDKKK